MIRDQININTYLNIVIAIILAFFGYIGLQYEKRFDSLEMGIRENRAIMDRKFEQLLSITNENKVNLAKIAERQNYSDIRIQNLETAFYIKGNKNK